MKCVPAQPQVCMLRVPGCIVIAVFLASSYPARALRTARDRQRREQLNAATQLSTFKKEVCSRV